MPRKFKGIFASSTDPSGQTLSLTVASFTQAIIGIVGTYAVVKGIDPAIAVANAQSISDQIRNIVAQGTAMAAAAYSAYHSLQFIFGVVRKFFPMVPVLPDLGHTQGFSHTYSVPTTNPIGTAVGQPLKNRPPQQ